VFIIHNKKLVITAIATAGISFYLFISPISASAASELLKEGSRGSAVTELQKSLKQLGYLQADATGYYGELTEAAVKNLQRKYGLAVDGIAGQNTFSLIKRLTNNTSDRGSSASSGNSGILKKGSRGSDVTSLQNDLRKLGYLSANATGYYGDLTVAAVKRLQGQYGLGVDGVAGPKTFSLIQGLKDGTRSTTSAVASRGAGGNGDYLVSWFKGAENIFKIGAVATVYDVDTGTSFKLKRTYGTNHADVEPLTAEDTKAIKKLYGGQWSWERRAVIVDVDGRKMAASLAGMPHAGVDSAAANKYVNSRSGGYGRGANLDAVKGNNVDGVLDLHFLNSKTHGTNRVNDAHQRMVKKAAEWAKKNL
jgi:peptidoglycan hydrolase-like protein with peptidoglycan-binding domain